MKCLKTIAFAAAFLLLAAPAHAQDVPDVTKLVGVIRWSGILFSLFVIAGAVVALRVVGDVSARLSRRFATRRPAIQKVESIIRFATYIVAIGMAARAQLQARLDDAAGHRRRARRSRSASRCRDLVSSFIAGITIMFDRPFQVGDRVAYAGQYGDIIKIGLRSTRMNTLDHNIITIPNNKVLTDVPASGNYGALEMQAPFDFYIGVDQDAELAAELIREACLTSPYVFLDRPVPVLGKQVILQDYVAMHLKCAALRVRLQVREAVRDGRALPRRESVPGARIRPPAVLHRTLDAQPDHRAT